MKYIIMCGGHYDYWQQPKQLTCINGEPIVMRTIRLLHEAGIDDIAISTNDERFSECGVPLIGHDNDFVVHAYNDYKGHWVDCFVPCNKPMCYLFGDVVFSPEAIKTIVSTQVHDVMFFASAPPFSEVYCKTYAEPFAFKVNNQRHFREAIDFVKENEHTGIFCRPPIAWELWQVINQEHVRDINYENYIAINDYTCDIDCQEDVEKIEKAMEAWQKY